MSQQQYLPPELKTLYDQLQQRLQQLRGFEQAKSAQIESRQQLDSQRSENDLVLKELNHLEPGRQVYKLIGPALVSQDCSDAKNIVEKRIEYIASEMKKVDAAIGDLEKKEEEEKAKIVEVQRKMQEVQQRLTAGQQQSAH